MVGARYFPKDPRMDLAMDATLALKPTYLSAFEAHTANYQSQPKDKAPQSASKAAEGMGNSGFHGLPCSSLKILRVRKCCISDIHSVRADSWGLSGMIWYRNQL